MTIDNLTVVIAYRNGTHVIDRTLDAVPDSLPVIVVDDLSDVAFQTSRKNVQVIRRATRGYPAGAYNSGIAACNTDVLLIGQDNELHGTDWLQLLSKREQYGTIGDGVFQHPAWTRGYVQATWMFMRRDAVQRVGLFNERDYPAWGTTAEWQLRMCRAGFKALPVTVPGLSHNRKSKSFGDSFSRAMQDEPEKRGLFLRTPPMISVIVPCYNYGRYLSDALGSLIGGQTSLGAMSGQTFQSFEVIIVDDASTDNSLEIAKSLADPWKAIHVYRNVQNVGTAETLNAGIRQARGKYIAILSADDMCEPTRLEEMFRLQEANPHSCIYDDIRIFRDGQRAETMLMMEPYDFEQLLVKNKIPCGLMYPKQAWEETGGYPALFSNGREDWAFNVALGAKGYCGIHLRKPLFLYRREKQNRTLRNAGTEWRRVFVSKMQATFPELYRGERSEMCCGSSNRRTRQAAQLQQRIAQANRLAAPQQLVGAPGMVAIEYLGNAAGPMTFTGAETKAQYLFGGRRKVGYIDARDLEGFLGLYHNQRQLFRPTVVTRTEPVKNVETINAVPTETVMPTAPETTATVPDAASEEQPSVEAVSEEKRKPRPRRTSKSTQAKS